MKIIIEGNKEVLEKITRENRLRVSRNEIKIIHEDEKIVKPVKNEKTKIDEPLPKEATSVKKPVKKRK
jgi:hypothetical protein